MNVLFEFHNLTILSRSSVNVVASTWYHNSPVANNISSKIYWLSQSVIDSHTCSKTVSLAMAGGAATVLVCSATTNAERNKTVLKPVTPCFGFREVHNLENHKNPFWPSWTINLIQSPVVVHINFPSKTYTWFGKTSSTFCFEDYWN